MNNIKAFARMGLIGIGLLLLVVVMAVLTNKSILQNTSLVYQQPGAVNTQPYPAPQQVGVNTQAYPAPQGDTGTSQENQDILATQVAQATATTSARITAKKNSPTSTPAANSPSCFVDTEKQYTLMLPPGWNIDVPEKGDASATIVSNFTYEQQKANGMEIPDGGIQIEIVRIKYDAGKTFEQWVSDDNSDIPAGTPKPAPYQLGKHQGYSQVWTVEGKNILDIWIPAGESEGLKFRIHPADSKGLNNALSLLTSLDTSGSSSCSQSANPVSIEMPSNLDQQILSSQESLATPAPCPTGTFPGNEAYSSTIPLDLPFRAGETWVVGGQGAFYGNTHHCNSYDAYYATDWNWQGGISRNFPVYALYDGTVSGLYNDNTCLYNPANRYGCYVQVDHVNGYRTIYAHLINIPPTIGVGFYVHAGDMLGHVGNSGNADFNHLHLGFQHYDQGGYHSYCYNNGQTCPNGEAPIAPQGYKPSPMDTSGA